MTTKLTRTDLKFYPSERLADYPDSGGLALGTPIKGEANEIFDPISGVERTSGGYAMRLIYAGVQRADDEPLIGANVAITKPPVDDSVSYLLTTANFGELRSSGVSRVENYVSPSIESSLILLSSPPKGSKIVQAYQRVGEKLPSVGDVFCLSQQKQGYPNHSQFIQVMKVESAERTFTDAGGTEFNRMTVKLEINQPLAYDFVGADYPSRYYLDNPCKIRETTVSDSSRYFGVKPLATAVKAGAMAVQVPSLMAKIVPTAITETALLDMLYAPNAPSFFAQTDKLVWISLGHLDKLQLPPFMPNSLTASTSGGEFGDKDGKLILNGQEVGVIEYATGLVLINENARHYIYRLSIIPQVATNSYANTYAIAISEANRGYTYAINLPKIAIGSMRAAYLAQGKWYELRDNGLGQLVGATAEHGSGTVNYQTGTVAITTGEMPDTDSAIILSWGVGVRLHNLPAQPLTPFVRLKLRDNAKPATINLSLGSYTAKVGVNGKLTGQLTGHYDYANNEVWVRTDTHEFGWGFSATGSTKQITVQYSTGTPTQKTLTNQRPESGRLTLQLSDTPILAGTVQLSAKAVIGDTDKQAIADKGATTRVPDNALMITLTDDGAGNLINAKGETVGTIDYNAGTATLNAAHKATILESATLTLTHTTTSSKRRGGLAGLLGKRKIVPTTHTRAFDNGYTPKEIEVLITGASVIDVSYFEASADSGTTSESLPVGDIYLTIPKQPFEKLASGSVWLNFGGTHQMFDNLGGIYKDYNANTGQGVKVGTIDYDTGVIRLNQYTGLNRGQLLMATIIGEQTTLDECHFATPIRPIRPSSLQIRATTTDGANLSATANQDGELKADGIDGVIDSKTGIAHIRFGNWVTATGNENKVWYDQKAVVDGEIWQPVPVIAESIKYTAIATSELPVDSNIIKIDTVRLPNDGRVPIFRVGDMILIGNRQTTELGSAFTGGQTVQLPRQNLDRICVKDSNGKPLDANLYDDDLENGTVSFKSPLDLSGYKLPLVAMHAIEEKNRISGVDIDGTLTLMFPLKNSYDTQNTYVSSILTASTPNSTLQVRSSVPFTQKNWNGKWADEPNGDPLLNRLNVKDYPIILTDDGAINERWLIKFTSSTQFELYGQTLGFVMRTDILQDLKPINPSTGKPYFTLDKRAFGGSDTAGSQGQVAWASQDVIRFNTEGTLMPFWVIRAVAPSQHKQVGEDGFTLCLFGDTTEQ